jgi:hypothetical protein
MGTSKKHHSSTGAVANLLFNNGPTLEESEFFEVPFKLRGNQSAEDLACFGCRAWW